MELLVLIMYFYMLPWIPVMNEEYEDEVTLLPSCSRIIIPGFWTGNVSINYTFWPEFVLEPFVPFQYEIFGYSYFVIFILGCIGNVLIVIVFCKNRDSYPSTSVYLTALAVSDVTTLLSAHVYNFICQIYNIRFMDFSELACKLVPFVKQASKQTSSWLLVAVTLERTVTVMCPFKVKYTCTRKVATIAVIVICVISCGKESHLIYGWVYHRDGYCYNIDEYYANYLYDVDSVFAIISNFAVPFIVLLFGNILIICKLINNANRRSQITSSRINKEKGIKVMLVFASIAFLLTMSPTYILALYVNYNYSILFGNEDNVFNIRKFIFLGSLDKFLSNLNSVVNFYLYYYSGTKFRADLKKVFHCKKKVLPCAK